MSVYIFDLDDTIIDSSHRQRTLPNGNLDIVDYLANNTWEKIKQDKLLPLAKVFKNLVKQGHMVVISTSRTLQGADYNFLRNHNLWAHRIFSRPESENGAHGIPAYEMKKAQLAQFIAEENITHAVMYDDNLQVREAVAELGIETVDPFLYNQTH